MADANSTSVVEGETPTSPHQNEIDTAVPGGNKASSSDEESTTYDDEPTAPTAPLAAVPTKASANTDVVVSKEEPEAATEANPVATAAPAAESEPVATEPEATRTTDEATASAAEPVPAAASPSETAPPAEEKEGGKVLVERNGSFVYVDKSELESMNLSVNESETDNNLKETQRATSAPVSNAGSPQATTQRPKTAAFTGVPHWRPRVYHTDKFSGLGRNVHAFSSEENRNAFEDWYQRKEQQRKHERSLITPTSPSKDELERTRKEAEQAWVSWNERKERQAKEERERRREEAKLIKAEEQKLEAMRTQRRHMDSHGMSHSAEYAAAKKKETDEQRQKEREYMAEMHERMRQEMEEQKRASEEAVREWNYRKQIERQEKEARQKKLRSKYAREARQLNESLARSRYETDVSRNNLNTGFDTSLNRPKTAPNFLYTY